MSASTPSPLVENAGLAFSGEPEWMPATVTMRQLEILRTTPNPSGRPNADVLRGFLGLAANRFRERWQVDFAPHLTAQEAALYEAPFALLARKCDDPKIGAWWQNPQTNPGLRTSLAKLDRFLVTSAAAVRPAWNWVDAGWLPDHSLLAVARDDDFVLGVLQSRVFAAWWEDLRPADQPLRTLECFPFPWPPRTPVGALTGLQQDLRFEVARAGRVQDAAQLDGIVASAYGWPPALDEAELRLRLQRLHQRRAASGR